MKKIRKIIRAARRQPIPSTITKSIIAQHQLMHSAISQPKKKFFTYLQSHKYEKKGSCHSFLITERMIKQLTENNLFVEKNTQRKCNLQNIEFYILTSTRI